MFLRNVSQGVVRGKTEVGLGRTAGVPVPWEVQLEVLEAAE